MLPERVPGRLRVVSTLGGELRVDEAVLAGQAGAIVGIDVQRGGHVARDEGGRWPVRVGDTVVGGNRVLAANERVRVGHHLFVYLAGSRIEADYHSVIYRLMSFDAVTGLLNRRAFAGVVEDAQRRGTAGVVIELGPHGLAALRETEGPVVADDELCAGADRLRAALRGGETAARVADHTFAIHIPTSDAAHAEWRTIALRAAVRGLH